MTDKSVKVNIECGIEFKDCSKCDRITKEEYYLGIRNALNLYLIEDEGDIDEFIDKLRDGYYG